MSRVLFQCAFLISAVLLPQAVHAADAGQHSVTVRISKGAENYTHKMRATEGEEFRFTGAVAPRKQLQFTGCLTPVENGAMHMQYQLELSGGTDDIRARIIQVQSELLIRPGEEINVVKCGPWTVMLGADKQLGGEKPGGPWNPSGLQNYRLTMNMRVDGYKERCQVVSKTSVTSSIIDSETKEDLAFRFIFNSMLEPTAAAGNFSLDYQTELGTKGIQGDGIIPLGLNKKKAVSGKGYSLDFLLEGNKDSGKKSEPKSEYGTVQPL